MLKFLKFCILARIATVSANSWFTSCFTCAKSNEKNSYCDWGSEKGQLIACCEQDSKSVFCQPTKKNKCYGSYNDEKQLYYMNCPTESPKTQTKKAMCDKNTP